MHQSGRQTVAISGKIFSQPFLVERVLCGLDPWVHQQRRVPASSLLMHGPHTHQHGHVFNLRVLMHVSCVLLLVEWKRQVLG
jgi:hypothetical protein